ncbi:MAG: hypoxanthine phosphoribosyltransferase [Epulopiscium sp. Nele67-Bin005]|nr:MAG: hypoxanthine phosphoribosyltransferase [Epulopiscium sp. Nele67-Bin005]
MLSNLEILISENDIQTRVNELAKQISNDYKEKDLVMLCVLKGGVMFMADLAKQITVPLVMEFLVVSSYGNDTKSSGKVSVLNDLSGTIKGRDILIVEDIIDTGQTLNYLVQYLNTKEARTIKICTLLDKKEQRITNVNVDYIGFTVPNAFVVGYGLDYQQYYRNLPYIAVNNMISREES